MTEIFAQSAVDTMVCDKHYCCCSSDPTPAGVMISHVHRKNEWMLSYRFMNMGMSELFNGTKAINQTDVFSNYLMVPTNMQMNMHMLMGMYGITNKLTLMAMLNYNLAEMSMKMYSPTSNYTSIVNYITPYSMTHTMKTSGIGDVKLYALYGIINTANHHLLASIGASLPTGNINFKGSDHSMMYPNERYPYAMQLGSGTFDALPTISYLLQKNKIAFSVQVSSIIRTYNNAIGYKLGNEVTLNTWAAYKLFNFLSCSLRAEGTVAAKISGNDPTLYYYNEPSANPYNYGGKRINCYGGLTWQNTNGCLKNYKLGAEFGVPVYQNLNGIQLSNKYTICISLSRKF